MSGNTTTPYSDFTIPAAILRQPFVASGSRAPGSKFVEHVDDNVPCWTEPILIDNEETTKPGPALTTSFMNRVNNGIKFLRNKPCSALHILIATIAILAMALVSLREIYAFLTPTTFETVTQAQVTTCQTGSNIYDITATSWDMYIADFTFVTVNTQDDDFFLVTEEDNGYDACDEHEDDDDIPDDISEDSCLWMPEEGSHFLQNDTTWDMMKLAAGITTIENQFYRTPSPQPAQYDSDVQEFLAQMEAEAQEDSGSEWSDDDQDSRQDPFNVPANYDNSSDYTLPRAAKGLGNCREWYYEELDAAIPFPGYDIDVEMTEPEFIDAGINEAVAIEDPWAYEDMEDERLKTVEGWSNFCRLYYMEELYPPRARFPVTYASSTETAAEPEFYDEELEFEDEVPEPTTEDEEIPMPPSYLWASFDEGDDEGVPDPPTYLWASFNKE